MKKYMGLVAVVALLGACDKDAGLQEEEAQLVSGVYLDNLDTTVIPGDDFNQYVNGGWMDRTEIPADKSSYGSFNILRDNAEEDVKKIIEEASAAMGEMGSNEQKVGDFYNAYMDMEKRNALGISPLAPELAKIDAITDAPSLAAYFAYADKVGFGAPFGMYVGVDAKIPTQYSLHTWQTGLGLPNREYYFKDDEKSVDIREKYIAHIEKMLVLAGLEDPAGSAAKIMDLETALAEHHWLKEENRNAPKRYNKYAVADLDKVMADFDWTPYFAATGVAGVSEIIINQPSYLQGLNTILTSTDLATWRIYLKWGLVNSMANALNAAMDDQNFDFYSKTMRGVEKQRDQWRRAVSAVNGNLGEVVGKVYVDRHFTPVAKERMLNLVNNLIKAYEVSIKDIDWMGEETKVKALEKLHNFTPKIGYPDIWKDYSALEVKGDDLFGNLIRSNIVEHNRAVDKLGGPILKHEWAMTPQTVNAYYSPTKNEIVFPAAILQPPFFNLAADDALNYGAIGGVIGHEIGHGFDDSGSRYNGDGKLENWWTDTDRTEFDKRTSALVKQYDSYTVLDDVHVNGTYTLGENIGDLSGLSIGYKAYKMSLNGKPAPVIDGYSGDQRFFIGWAQAFQSKYRDKALLRRINTDPHSPGMFRVNGVVRNFGPFYEAFEVKAEEALYLSPEDRVRIW